MPALTKEYGLLPWHFGGDDELTFREQRAYLDHYDDLSKARQKAARQQQRNRRR